MIKLTWTPADKWLIAVLLTVALAGITAQYHFAVPAKKKIEIRVRGELVHSITPRTGDWQIIPLESGTQQNVIEIRDGQVRMQSSSCADQACVHTGWLNAPPRQIVCLPHEVVISIVAAQESDIDDIVR